MRSAKKGFKEIKTEILIIGSEASGAKAAIEAQEDGADVLVVTKGLVGRSGDTVVAGYGIQAPIGHMDPRDNPDVFFEDVIKGGAYLNNQKLVERLVKLAVNEIPKMEKWGVKFQKVGDKFFQYATPGASYPRSLHPIGHAGHQYRGAFSSQFKRLGTKILEDFYATNLLVVNGEVAGAMGISLRDGQFMVLRSKNTILATGGCPYIYRMTDASRDATGDGMSMAYNAGAELMDMEFQQFFPFCSYAPPFDMEDYPAGLRYSLRGKFYNSQGEAFMERYLPLAKEWGLRDPTSRAIYLENMYGRGSPHGGAYLSVTHLPENLINDWKKKNAQVKLTHMFEKAGIDIRKDAVECGPGAHYSMGGVRINENCETSLSRLYAIGEVAAGMDGAERIDGGPAITWCLTMGYIAGKEAARRAKELDWPDVDSEQVDKELKRVNSLYDRKEGIRGFQVKDKIRDIMWKFCAVLRDGKGLREGLDLIQKIKSDDLPRLCVPDSSKIFNKGLVDALAAENMTELSQTIVRAALMREESRKSHYRTDFPNLDNGQWFKNIVIKKERGRMKFTTVPPVITRMKPSVTEGITE